MVKVIHAIAHPVHYVADKCVRTRKGRVRTRLCAGVTLILGGAFMATHPAEWCNHALWDGMAYSIHALGIAPVFSHLANILPLLLKD
jgi:hypothetical protein